MLRELDRYHMIKRDSGRNLERKITIGGKHPRRVWVKREIVWPELQRPPSTQNSVGNVGNVGKFDATPHVARGEAGQNFPTSGENFPTSDGHVGKFGAAPAQALTVPAEQFPTCPIYPTPLDVQSDPAGEMDGMDDTGWPDESSAPSVALNTWEPWDDTPTPPPASARARDIAERARRAGDDAWAAQRNGRTSAEGDEMI